MPTTTPRQIITGPRRLTVKERALWMFQRLVPGSGVANEAIALTVRGRLDSRLLARELSRLAVRHPALRTVYPELRGEPHAVVLDPAAAALEPAVFDHWDGTLPQALAAFAGAPFDLAARPPVRAGLWRGADGDVLCLALHHLAYDTWTAGILVQELVAGYNAALDGRESEPRTETEVAPFREPEPDAASLAHWRAHVAGLRTEDQRLAIGRDDPPVRSFAGRVRTHRLSAAACAATTTLARRHKVTENVVQLSAYYLLLARHGAGPDLVVGVPADVRGGGDRESVGYHVNTLPLRVLVDLDAGFGDLVRATGTAFFNGLGHRHVPYEAVLPELQSSGPGWHSPLFRHMFNYRPLVVPPRLELAGRPAETLLVDLGHSRHDLEFIVQTGSGGGEVRAVYSTEIFEDDDVRALQERFDALLVALAEADGSLRTVPWWSPADRAAVELANATADDDEAVPVAAEVWERIRRTPEAVAFVADGRETSYRRLGEEARAVAARLARSGVTAGDVVALHARRGPGLAAAVLGVWATGAAYLPLHPENPAEMIGFQLRDAGARVVLADRPLPVGTRSPCPVLLPEEPGARGPGEPGPQEPGGAKAPAPPAGADRAYLIYTSGSTGRPKGVELSHVNLANLVRDFRDRLGATAADPVLWLTTFAFDISALELFLPLVCGAPVVVAPDEARARPELAVELIRRHGVSIVQATPTTLGPALAVAGDALAGRRVLCGGEPMAPWLAAGLLAAGCRPINVYGPTETTIWSTAAELGPDEPEVTVGVPVRNTTVTVAGPDGTPLPPGLPGEVWIGGAGVALGYRDRPELTAARFTTDAHGNRHYRTGDRGRWRADGRLVLLGRDDRQVKIRSHRLELGEVEAAFASHPAVTAAAVVLHPDLPEQARLVAFVQCDGATAPVPERELWEHARRLLPGYALPNRIVLGPVPVNSSGKADHRRLATTALPSQEPSGPHAPGRTAGPAGPDDRLTIKVVALWQDLLEDPDIQERDNFFLSGGHSMLAVQMLTALGARTGTFLGLDDLLNAPTPAELAALLRAGTEGDGHRA
ncbi:amino acid adenylation domain-containing protein [Streptomyces sp. NPDC006435]|uniref:non-ribosomal peptide synthetase n=1 Tax=Streptomyces sp. NPDC006435 TaxID=3154300 RepID=UPI0033BC338C